MKPIIQVNDLSKIYRIGAKEQRYKTFREAVVDAITAPIRNLRRLSRLTNFEKNNKSENDSIWALKNVSFEINQGEVVGIIGRNGAGKSTLLKVLSRITEPTTGDIKIYGRIASLLEVGTGFHPELTGRENIYLNGTILGMRKSEIQSKFDEIVEFSEIEKFLDTPVKYYSSGMYVRLAFAVAAHLEPDILLVDEVLAVGDAAFQKKCLGKMGDVAREGRTVLLVSHNMSAISFLCPKVIFLNSGCLDFYGETSAGIDKYLLQVVNQPVVTFQGITENRWGPQDYTELISLSLFNDKNEPCDTFAMGDSIVAHLEVYCQKTMPDAEVGIKISSRIGLAIHYFVSTWEGLRMDLPPGLHKFELKIPNLLVYPGTYLLSTWVLREGNSSDDTVQGVASISVVGRDITGHKANFDRYASSGSEVYSPCTWRLLTS